MFLVDHHREDLFELVDDQDQLRVVRRQDPLDRPEQAELVAFEVLLQIPRARRGNAEQRRAQLLERVAAGRHLHHEPPFGATEGPTPEGRNQARADERGLAAPRGADHR